MKCFRRFFGSSEVLMYF